MTTIEQNPPEKRGVRHFLSTRKGKRTCFVLAVLLPFMVWMLIFMIIPLFSVIVYAFTDAKMAYNDFHFVALYQFEKIFSNKSAIQSILNTFKAAIIIMPASLILSVLCALGLNAINNRARSFYTFIYFLPSIVSMTAICLVFNYIYHDQFGILNYLITLLGKDKIPFLKDTKYALATLCSIHIWSIFGYYAVILFSNMRGIDKSLYEAADLDGANSWAKFWKITIPMLKNSLLYVTIMLTSSAFMLLTPMLLLTDGTPGTSTLTMLLHIYKQGIEQGNIGYSSAMSLLLMAMIAGLSALQMFLTREKD